MPNAAARSLRSRRTGQIAFAMPDVANPVYTTMVGSIQQVARSHGSRLILHSTERRRRRRARRSSRDLQQRFVDGLILCSLEFTDSACRGGRRRRRAGRRDRQADEGRAGRHRARELAPRRGGRGAPPARAPAAGGSRFVNGPAAHGAGLARASSATSTGCARAGSSATTRSSRSPTTSRSSAGRERGRAAARARDGRTRSSAPTTCSRSARSSALRAAGLDVPRDVAVVGMDNTSLSARHLAAADDGRPRLGRARAHRRRAAARAHRAARAPRRGSSASSRASSSAPRAERPA